VLSYLDFVASRLEFDNRDLCGQIQQLSATTRVPDVHYIAISPGLSVLPILEGGALAADGMRAAAYVLDSRSFLVLRHHQNPGVISSSNRVNRHLLQVSGCHKVRK
jgi:hypothetical protein